MRIQILILGFKGLREGGCLGEDCLIEVQLYKYHGKIKASLSRVLDRCL